MPSSASRRAFLSSTAAVLAAATARAQTAAPSGQAPVILPRPVALGFDNFSLRAYAWKAPRLLEYATTIGADSVFISDLEAFESLEEPALRKLHDDAAARNLTVHVGTWSVCPTSKAFRAQNGTAEEQLTTAIRTARLLGSSVVRVVLGTWEDRLTPGGIGRHIDSLVAVLKGGWSPDREVSLKSGAE